MDNLYIATDFLNNKKGFDDNIWMYRLFYFALSVLKDDGTSELAFLEIARLHNKSLAPSYAIKKYKEVAERLTDISYKGQQIVEGVKVTGGVIKVTWVSTIHDWVQVVAASE